jgi:hypothetical protein
MARAFCLTPPVFAALFVLAPPSAGAAQRRILYDEEFSEGASWGPSMADRPILAMLPPEEQRRIREQSEDPSEPRLPNVLALFVGIGPALGASLDRALVAHRYGSSSAVVLADVSFLGRVNEWLQLGGRLGARGRGWASQERDLALAGGVDALAMAQARIHFGRSIDLGGSLGIGLGWAGLSLGSGATVALCPRLHGGVTVAFRVARGIRMAARFSWDWFSLYDLDRDGSDLDLGGPALALGLEVRR